MSSQQPEVGKKRVKTGNTILLLINMSEKKEFLNGKKPIMLVDSLLVLMASAKAICKHILLINTLFLSSK